MKTLLIAILLCGCGCSSHQTIGHACKQTDPTDDDHLSIWGANGDPCAKMFLGADDRFYIHIYATSEDAVFDSQMAAEGFVNAKPYRGR